VEVDPDTGLVKVLHFTSAHDIGRVINPLLAEGQVEGGVVQGLGWTLMEDTVFKGGGLLTTDFTDYKIFTAMDSVPIESLWIESHDPNGPFGAKGFSEAANIPTAPAVANAIYDAVGIRFNHLPITPEKILRGLKKLKPR
jgi:CO/xanthine dehydrogenase Mo-binding subunit